MVCSTCGHPRERHLFQRGECVNASKNEGGGVRYCHCPEFVAPTEIRKPVPENIDDWETA